MHIWDCFNPLLQFLAVSFSPLWLWVFYPLWFFSYVWFWAVSFFPSVILGGGFFPSIILGCEFFLLCDFGRWFSPSMILGSKFFSYLWFWVASFFSSVILGGEFFPLCDFGRWAAFLSDELVLAGGCASCISHSLPHTVQRPRLGRVRIEIRLEPAVYSYSTPDSGVLGQQRQQREAWHPSLLLGLLLNFGHVSFHSWKKGVRHSAPRDHLSFCRQKWAQSVENLTSARCAAHPSL